MMGRISPLAQVSFFLFPYCWAEHTTSPPHQNSLLFCFHLGRLIPLAQVSFFLFALLLGRAHHKPISTLFSLVFLWAVYSQAHVAVMIFFLLRCMATKRAQLVHNLNIHTFYFLVPFKLDIKHAASRWLCITQQWATLVAVNPLDNHNKHLVILTNYYPMDRVFHILPTRIPHEL